MTEIVLNVHICDQRRSYKATFATEEQALAFVKARWSTHVCRPWDDETFPWDEVPRLDELWNPMCDHGLSQWLCADPVNHYPSDAQLAGGW